MHAGDFIRTTVLSELMDYGEVAGVHGNVDEPALRALLPARRVVDLGGARIGVVHVAGPRVGREARLVAAFPGCAAVVYGHTHVPQVDRHTDVWILNPGSPTERRRAPAHTMLLVAAEGGVVQPQLVELGT